jgi:hypothetical protein
MLMMNKVTHTSPSQLSILKDPQQACLTLLANANDSSPLSILKVEND